MKRRVDDEVDLLGDLKVLLMVQSLLLFLIAFVLVVLAMLL